jgi:hypothetical protein
MQLQYKDMGIFANFLGRWFRARDVTESKE